MTFVVGSVSVSIRRPNVGINESGQDIHFIAATPKSGKEFSWVCTHKVS
jgi:hypothetical protein